MGHYSGTLEGGVITKGRHDEATVCSHFGNKPALLPAAVVAVAAAAVAAADAAAAVAAAVAAAAVSDCLGGSAQVMRAILVTMRIRTQSGKNPYRDDPAHFVAHRVSERSHSTQGHCFQHRHSFRAEA